MPAITNPTHDSFPKNNKLYRIFWAGEILLPESSTLTPRVRIWLKEVDEAGNDVPDSPIVEVTESAGAIPRLAIGSCWRNAKLARPKSLNPVSPRILDIEAPDQWSVVKAGDPHGWHPRDPHTGRSHCWINPSDLQLSFLTSNGRRVNGHHAWVVHARTIYGEEVIIPSYEIFRALLANTTDLSLALLGNTWDAVKSRFVISAEIHETLAGVSCHLDLAPNVPHSTVPYLTLLSFVNEARRAANSVYPGLVRQGPMSQLAWIPAFPPVAGRPFRIRAQTVRLASRNAVLVTRILGFDPGLKISELSYSVAKWTFPTGDPVAGEAEGKPRKVLQPPTKGIKIAKPGDRRPGNRPLQLPSMSVKWAGLPVPKRTARRIESVPLPIPGPEITIPPSTTVSVGEPGSRGSPSPGSFTPEEERNIEDRFEAIRDLADLLVSEEVIDSVTDYPLVRPVPADFPEYCEFPTEFDGKPWKWSIVRKPIRRARLAIVLEIKLAQRTVYWIETEALSARDMHHSLVIETVGGGPLDEGTLATLLDTCALAKGVWPQKLEFGDGSILYERARHIPMGAELSPNTMLLPFARLAHKRHRLRTEAADGASAGQAAHPE